jgi:hypothetical protein
MMLTATNSTAAEISAIAAAARREGGKSFIGALNPLS